MSFNKICVFDFDDTIVRSPGPDCAKLALEFLKCKKLNLGYVPPTLEEIKNNVYVWWDSHLSLDQRLFDIKVFPAVKEAFDRASSDPECKIVLITHRTQKSKDDVLYLLELNWMKFDQCMFGGRNVRRKTDMLAEAMKDVSPVTKVDIYEDSIEEIRQYESMLIELGSIVNYHIVNTKYILTFKNGNVPCEYTSSRLHYYIDESPVK